ncbi:hypothetical protein OAQ27_04045 [Aquiluna sp.]|nr:hypothetical protein [Aquiluna sp.]
MSEGQQYSSVWCFDFTWKACFHLFRVPRSQRFLFIFEPRTVLPAQHRRVVQKIFGRVFVFSHGQRNEDTEFIQGGGAFSAQRQASLQKPKFDVVMANANKSSAVRGSLYHLRVHALVAAAKSNLTVGLAGSGWESSRVALKQTMSSVAAALTALEFPLVRTKHIRRIRLLNTLENVTLLGSVSSLGDFYTQGRVALVIENDPEFLSEKLFNAIAAAQAVVYVGTEEAKKYSMPGIYFANPDVESVATAIRSALSGHKIASDKANKVLRLRSQDLFERRLVARVNGLNTSSSGKI